MKNALFTFLVLTLVPLPIFFTEEVKLKPIKILLVPGHDDEIWGAQYGNVKEANMNLAVARRIFDLLKKDERFEVLITRNNEGYVEEFADYLSIQQEHIILFRENAKEVLEDLIKNESFLEKESVPHNTAPESVSVILYGINKWVNENNVDAVIHTHFNDYKRKNKWQIGDRTGFTVYVPEEQMVNSKESNQLGLEIFSQLNKKYITSNYEKEKGGFVNSQKLIALGANGTLLPSVRSVLIEYGYIYEKKFRSYTTRHQAYDDMANLTAQGIKDYFFPE